MYECIKLDKEFYEMLFEFYGQCDKFDHNWNCLECSTSGRKRITNPNGDKYYFVPANGRDVSFNYCDLECPEGYWTVGNECIKCAKGYYYDETKDQCKTCEEYDVTGPSAKTCL